MSTICGIFGRKLVVAYISEFLRGSSVKLLCILSLSISSKKIIHTYSQTVIIYRGICGCLIWSHYFLYNSNSILFEKQPYVKINIIPCKHILMHGKFLAFYKSRSFFMPWLCALAGQIQRATVTTEIFCSYFS